MNTNDENRTGIPLFDGTNYNNWFFRMETLLDEKSLLQYIQEDLETEIIPKLKTDKEISDARHAEKRCKTIIVRSTHDSQLEIIKDKESAKAMIDSLRAVFERKSIASQLLLRRRLLTLKYSESDEMADHFVAFDKLFRELKSSGAKLEEIDIVCHLLLTMPKAYDNLVTALETMEQEKLTVDFVKSRLLDEANKRNGGRGMGANSKQATAMNANVICYTCNKPGHYQSSCRYNKRKDGKGKCYSNYKRNFDKFDKKNQAVVRVRQRGDGTHGE